MRALSLLLLALLPLSARAAEPDAAELRRAQLESLRAQVADQLQLQAYDLLDELVFSWTEQPPFEKETPVVLAEVSVPVGFGSGLQALLENHFLSLVVNNPRTHVVAAHCPQCTSVVVRSGAKGTVVARGVDEPEALEKAGLLSGARHALFLDFEAEGSSLVLRARMTALEKALPIVYARTLSTSTSSPALLRSGERLKSAPEARQEYLDALEGRGPVLVPVRIGVRTYATNPNATVIVAPFIWLNVGAEVALTQARAWTASFSAGVSWMPQLHTGFIAQARVARLLTGSATSLTHPDLYVFAGGSVTSLHGPGAVLFRPGPVPTLEELLGQQVGGNIITPSTMFGAIQAGLEVRMKNRIGASVFLESLPGLGDAESLGRYLNFGFLPVQAFGAEVSFCF